MKEQREHNNGPSFRDQVLCIALAFAAVMFVLFWANSFIYRRQVAELQARIVELEGKK